MSRVSESVEEGDLGLREHLTGSGNLLEKHEGPS